MVSEEWCVYELTLSVCSVVVMVSTGAEFTSEDQGVYSCLIPDENGEEQVLHFGLYPHGFSEGETS